MKKVCNLTHIANDVIATGLKVAALTVRTPLNKSEYQGLMISCGADSVKRCNARCKEVMAMLVASGVDTVILPDGVFLAFLAGMRKYSKAYEVNVLVA